MARQHAGTAAVLIALYFIFLILALACYLRTFLTVKYNPGLVPPPSRPKSDADTEKGSYGGVRDDNPDSPGLEQFYSRHVFVCQSDGRPKWCNYCRNWKPDRAHHSSELERCVYRMDHFCPWVGGMVAENCECSTTQDMHLLFPSQKLTCPIRQRSNTLPSSSCTAPAT